MSMSSSTSSPRLSNMFVPVELASAPTIALKQVTLEVTKKISGQNKTKQNKIKKNKKKSFKNYYKISQYKIIRKEIIERSLEKC